MANLNLDLLFPPGALKQLHKAGSSLEQALIKAALDYGQKQELEIDKEAINQAYQFEKEGFITFSASGITFRIRFGAVEIVDEPDGQL
ncbi:hypothetical protein [Spirosoma sp.]|uniref:hypothetical protein n=1 Tax=Spirosoma sp. TaxID=1899569 RepID=UPI00262283B1|nr:hypothetical protein [Spirosoma sp.]MCX6216369.1 hypothetical protein [Spirosoma sp.]